MNVKQVLNLRDFVAAKFIEAELIVEHLRELQRLQWRCDPEPAICGRYVLKNWLDSVEAVLNGDGDEDLVVDVCDSWAKRWCELFQPQEEAGE